MKIKKFALVLIIDLFGLYGKPGYPSALLIYIYTKISKIFGHL